jgi:hypothetical protein
MPQQHDSPLGQLAAANAISTATSPDDAIKPASRSLETVAAKKDREVHGRFHITPKDFQSLAEIFDQVRRAGEEVAKPKVRAYVTTAYSHRDASGIEQQIAANLQRECDKLNAEWHVDLLDKTKLGPMTLDEVLRLPNTGQRRIISVEIGNQLSAQLAVSVKIRRVSLAPLLEYRLSGESHLVEKFSKKLDDFIETIRPVASWFFTPKVTVVLLMLLFLMVVTLASVGGQAAITKSYSALILTASATGAGLFLFFLRHVLFPKCEIAVGKETERLALLSKIRWVVLGVGISIAVGYFVKKLLLP